jgi:MFS family permease
VVPELVVAALVVAVVAALRGTWSPCGLSMLSSITPFGERARGHRYGLTCAWFVAGSTVGGAAMGGLAALGALAVRPLGDGATAWLLAVGVLGAVVCAASDARVGPVRLPTLPRQVDEAWLDTYRRWIYAAGFGVQIGAGFTTYVMTAANYLLVLLAVLSGSPAWALATGLVFGVTRGLVVTVGSWATTPARLRDLHRTLERWAAPSLRAMVALQGGVAVALAAAAAGPVAALGVLAVVVLVAAAAYARRRPAAVAGEVPVEVPAERSPVPAAR